MRVRIVQRCRFSADQMSVGLESAGRRLPVELRLASVGRQMTARALAAVEDGGLSEGAWWVLYELAGAPGGLPLVELARRTMFSASTVTAVTDQLAVRGWVTRKRDAEDRRRIVAVITQGGTDVLDAGLAGIEQTFAADRQRLSPAQWQDLENLLTQLTTGTASAISSSERQQLLRHLLDADEAAVVQLIRALLDGGKEPEKVLVDLIAPVQTEIGELWHGHRIAVAQEHLAAYITDRLITQVSVAGAPPARHRGSIAVACPAGEWHALPARLVAEVLALHGWRIDFLGASVPSSELNDYLRLRKPDVLLLSVTLPGNLPQAHRCLQVARAAGVFSLIGGRGIGANGQYARLVGADAWAADARSAATVLSQWPPAPSATSRTTELTDDGEYSALVQRRWQLIDSVLDSFRLELTPLRRHWATQMDETIAELNYLLDFLAAAVYLDDHTIFTDFIDWLRQLRSAHHWPPEPVDVALATLFDRLQQQPRTRAILTAGQQRRAVTTTSHSS